METAEPVRRTSEIEEITNLYLIHPVAARLTPVFAALHISPNTVSLTGMLFGILAGLAYYHYRELPAAVAGFGLMIGWHIMDGADGQLARLTHAQSELGKALDGICDYVTFIAVYVALAVALSRQEGGRVWFLVIAAGVCHAVQAAAYEAQRQEYEFWARGRHSKRLVVPDAPARGVVDWFYRQYIRLQLAVSGVSPAFRARLARALAARPEREAAIRQYYRDMFAPVVRRMSVLSANYRTLGIFVSAVFKAPQYYFWFEIVGFSAILIVFLVRQQTRYARFLDGLAVPG